MKRRILVVHGDQDRELENGDQGRVNTVSKKGNTQGNMEKRRGLNENEARMRTRTMRTRTRRGQGEDKDRERTGAKMRPGR